MAYMDQEIRDLGKQRVMQLDEEGRQAFEQGDYSLAKQLFMQAVEISRTNGWREEFVYQLLHVTQAMAHEPGYYPAAARSILDEALNTALATGLPTLILPVQINRIRLDLEEGRYSSGLRQIQESLNAALAAGFDDYASRLILFAAFACVGIEQYEAALCLNSAAQAQRDRLGLVVAQRPQRESIERNLAPARRAYPAGRRAAIEAIGYQMSLAEASDYVLAIRAPDKIPGRSTVTRKKPIRVRPV